MFLCLKLKRIMSLCSMTKTKKAPLHYVAALNIFEENLIILFLNTTDIEATRCVPSIVGSNSSVKPQI